ncbi:SH3 domain-containing protein [Sphingomonas fuzhouensis]|uniref:SH3 domain-containing protein n=1 Tax=Sphingomonas fuzhouensis TaxID=3106033 RepID=UPI002AFF7CC3|nr:SH3 domain-containing protein [Sphingomonas sp. SGZ-02]
MKNSDISSALATPLPSNEPARKSFALQGRTVGLDPRTHAVRPDLADVRLAEYVFAPHYAAPLPYRTNAPVTLREGRPTDSAVLAELRAGETFEVLELAGGHAWGIAPRLGLVGYCDAQLLERVQ